METETLTESIVAPARWWALHTRSRFEQKVHTGLCGKSLEAFLPRIEVMSRRKDRRKKILVPMIPGYVFVRSALAPEEYHRIIQTVGVVRIIAFKGKTGSRQRTGNLFPDDSGRHRSNR